MRHTLRTTLFFLPALVFSVLFAQGTGQNLSIANYQLVSQVQAGAQVNITYKADVVNSGSAVSSVIATVTSADPFSIRVLPGKDTLHFPAVPANGRATSVDTITILLNGSAPLDLSKLQWDFQIGNLTPVANAGPNQTSKVGATVTLDGSASSNPSGFGTLTYSWAFVSRPAGSAAKLVNPTALKPSFVIDVAGDYVVALTVSNGVNTATANVTVTTNNTPPVAKAGPDQTVAVGSIVRLNGSGSFDVDGNPLTYSWTLLSSPAGSAASLLGASTVSPMFVADKAGAYTVQLVVNDGLVDSAPSTVTISTPPQNSPPVANAGLNQIAKLGGLIQLNGAGSTDVNGLPLTYTWTLIARPFLSTANLSSTTAVNPFFTVDVAGDYVVQLIVHNGKADSAPSTVTITTNPPQAPVASAGPNQTIARQTTIMLKGSGTDPQNLPLTYAWSLTTKPAGSAAVLSNANTATPTFVADLGGTYVAQLVVNNTFLNSAPSTVVLTTSNTPPVADAGPNQNVITGATVTLDGSASKDADKDPLTYTWSFLTRPAGSAAVLTSKSSIAPSFVADTSGVYVLQLIVNDGIADSAPSTVMITAAAATNLKLTPNPLIFGSNTTGTLTLTLPGPAAAGGQVVELVTSDPGIATVPASITVPANATGANVVVTPLGIGSATIVASAAGFTSAAASVSVVVPTISIAVDNPTVGLTRTMNGKITLSAPAPAGGLVVNLAAAPDNVVTVPATIAIDGGSTTGTFTVTGAAVGFASIAATSPGYTSSQVSVNVGKLGAIVLGSGIAVAPNQSAPLPIKLVTPAPAGGVTITLTSSDPSVATVTPSSVFIPFRATLPAAQPQVNGISFGKATITASAPGFDGDSQDVVIAGSLAVSPSALTFTAGTSRNFTLTLTAPAPAAGLTINLVSSDPTVATVPATVSFAGKATTVDVPVTGVAAGSAVIHASALPGLADVNVTVVIVAPQPINLRPNLILGLGESAPFSVSLPTPAASAVTITLTSSDPTVATIPASVVIPAGSTTPAAPPQVTGVNLGTADITATAPGYSTVKQTVSVTASITFAGGITVGPGASGNLTLNLSSKAPAGGLTVNLTSSNTGVATVPATATFAAGTTSVPVPVTGIAQGTTTITAGAANLPNASVDVTVATASSILLPAGVSVGLGQSAPFAVTLSTPAAAPLTVTLTSSDPTKATVPASVLIPQGSTAPAVQPQVTGIAPGPVDITAAATGYTGSKQTVQVTGTLSFVGGLTINPSSSANLTLNLSGPAPAGLTIALSSSNTAVATVPATISFATGASSVQVPVQSLAQGSAILTASAPNLASATATVNVGALPAISLPANVSVGLGQSAPLIVTLPAPATAALTVTLTSSDPTKVSVPASVTIPQGSTTPAIQAQVTGVSPGSASITASAPGYTSATQPVQVTANLNFTGGLTVSATQTSNLTLTLSAPAPAGGLTVNVTSSNTSAATVPATVNFAAGASTTAVPVTGVAQGSAIITASGTNLNSALANANVVPLPSILMSPNLGVGLGQSTPLGVSLQTPAQSPVTISFTSSDPTKATVTASVVVPQGATTPATQPQVNGVSSGSTTITATAAGYSSANSVVSVAPPNIAVVLDSPNVGVTHVINGTFTLGVPAPAAGVVVTLTSTPGGMVSIQPSSFTIAAGNSTGTFVVTGVTAGAAVITASAPGYSSGSAPVTAQTLGAILLPPGVTLGPNQPTPFPITLVTPAPLGGVTITLTSADPSKVVISPSTVFIPFRSSTPAVQPQITGVGFGSTTITASAPGFTGDAEQVQVSGSIVFNPATLVVIGGTSGSLTLTLSSPASAAGGTINLSSSDPTIATVPATVTFQPGANTVTVPVKAISGGSVTIHASALPNLADTTANVIVFVFGALTLQPNVTVGVGQSAPIQVALPGPARNGGVTVTLTSSDESKATVTSSVFIPAGAVSPLTPAQVTGVAAGSATITASAPGFSPGIQPVQVTP